MRILYVANGFPPTALGGVETYTFEVARSMQRRGHSIWVFCRESCLDLPDYAVLQDKVDGINVFRVVNDFKNISQFSNYYENNILENMFEKFLLEVKPDLVHFQHLIALSARLPTIAADLKFPVVVSLHDFWALCHRVHLFNRHEQPCPGPFRGGDCVECLFGAARSLPFATFWSTFRRWATRLPFTLRSWWMRRRGGAPLLPLPLAEMEAIQKRHALFQAVLRRTHLLLAPSAFVRDVFVQNGFSLSNLHILPLGIDLPPSPPSRSPHFNLRMGYIGWFQPQKGVHVLVEAFRRLSVPDVSLHLFGAFDPAHPYAQALARQIGDDPRIHIHGPFQPDERGEVYGQLDVVVLPSLSPETFSRVAREALAWGVPVIASRLGALQEVVVNRVNGYTFPPGDVEALYKILEDLARHPESLRDLSLPGPVSLISTETHVDLLEEFYRSLLI